MEQNTIKYFCADYFVPVLFKNNRYKVLNSNLSIAWRGRSLDGSQYYILRLRKHVKALVLANVSKYFTDSQKPKNQIDDINYNE